MRTLLTLLLALFTVQAFAFGSNTVSVRGYYRSNGTYVRPHYRTAPNNSRIDNWSTKGNYNPYTGKAGTRSLYDTRPSQTTNSIYGSGNGYYYNTNSSKSRYGW